MPFPARRRDRIAHHETLRRRSSPQPDAVGCDHPAFRGAVIASVTERSCRRRAWLLLLGELSSATSGSLTVALRAAASELRGTGLLVRREREQAPTASSGTAACPGVATLLLNARSRRAGCLLASTSGAPGGCSDVALAMRPMLVAQRGSQASRAPLADRARRRSGFPRVSGRGLMAVDDGSDICIIKRRGRGASIAQPLLRGEKLAPPSPYRDARGGPAGRLARDRAIGRV